MRNVCLKVRWSGSVYHCLYPKAVADIPKLKAVKLGKKAKALIEVIRENPYQTPPPARHLSSGRRAASPIGCGIHNATQSPDHSWPLFFSGSCLLRGRARIISSNRPMFMRRLTAGLQSFLNFAVQTIPRFIVSVPEELLLHRRNVSHWDHAQSILPLTWRRGLLCCSV